ncbi:MAG: hypothetical protein WCI73_02855 [Phycisphaerae bacterium]
MPPNPTDSVPTAPPAKPAAPRILSVGQCGSDDSRLARLLGELGLRLERAPDAATATELLNTGHYALVLVNRIFDADGSSGLALIAQLGATVPVMLISDYPEAQAQAVAAGALAGFGKSQLQDPRTREKLRKAVRT